jgi:hypothetical protein
MVTSQSVPVIFFPTCEIGVGVDVGVEVGVGDGLLVLDGVAVDVRVGMGVAVAEEKGSPLQDRAAIKRTRISNRMIEWIFIPSHQQDFEKSLPPGTEAPDFEDNPRRTRGGRSTLYSPPGDLSPGKRMMNLVRNTKMSIGPIQKKGNHLKEENK